MRKMLSDRASEELKQRAMRECEIFERDVRLRHQKEQEKAEAARRKLEQERLAIDESRQQQLQCKLQEKEADRKLGELYVKELARISAQHQDLERQKELAKEHHTRFSEVEKKLRDGLGGAGGSSEEIDALGSDLRRLARRVLGLEEEIKYKTVLELSHRAGLCADSAVLRGRILNYRRMGHLRRKRV